MTGSLPHFAAQVRAAARTVSPERGRLDRLQRGGEAFVSNAVLAGRYALRACIVNFHTTQADVEALPEIVARVGRAVGSPRAPLRSG